MSGHLLAHRPVAFTADQRSVIVGGHLFAAKHGGEPGRCTGCAFKDGFGCALWREKPGSSLCQAKDREDGQGVVWVPAHTVKP